MIALTGGVLTAGALVLTGLLVYPLSQLEVNADIALVRASSLLISLSGWQPRAPGGVGFAGRQYGVPSLMRGLMPRSFGMYRLGARRRNNTGVDLADCRVRIYCRSYASLRCSG
ncbi:hypothetical protein DIJ64_03320 [Mycobacterium leprae]|uniref:Uncharacterized protein n=1 Tax=Mycobacterium leprae TaxID=1769 RepID=A0AAD0KRD8_MYCLR|nr:hypothetical protein [Mycobacterium leprae]AWV47474.1 hypothetical protein DIJ64_03320 [Mycobacterium leprae]OAR21661.1 hypothetical protein A8144_00060 [Mycobacterium leprae 3125609]OAX72199.1 hypothetical protein A3216_00115 [Mycobacterium leprae 7935681]